MHLVTILLSIQEESPRFGRTRGRGRGRIAGTDSRNTAQAGSAAYEMYAATDFSQGPASSSGQADASLSGQCCHKCVTAILDAMLCFAMLAKLQII